MAGDEAEDRTQGPSKQRLQQARELGQVAHSPELTAAAGLLAATLLLGVFGDDLAATLVGALREPLARPPALSADAASVASRLRHLAVAVGWPTGAILLGAAAAALSAHMIQVGGLWAPGLLVPDPSRLWAFGRGPGPASRGVRGAWGLVKAALVVALALALIRGDATKRQQVGRLGPRALASASGETLRRFTLTLAAATLALGLLDLYLQQRRYAAMLQMTPEEQREDLRSMEGDPRMRAQRRRIARALRSEPGEVLAGASLVLQGAGGLTLVLGGGPPPRRVTVRAVAQGTPGLRLRQAADRARVPGVASDPLARRLAGRGAALPLPPEDASALAALWPAPGRPHA